MVMYSETSCEATLTRMMGRNDTGRFSEMTAFSEMSAFSEMTTELPLPPPPPPFWPATATEDPPQRALPLSAIAGAILALVMLAALLYALGPLR
jgi:hypothetical protein